MPKPPRIAVLPFPKTSHANPTRGPKSTGGVVKKESLYGELHAGQGPHHIGELAAEAGNVLDLPGVEGDGAIGAVGSHVRLFGLDVDGCIHVADFERDGMDVDPLLGAPLMPFWL